MTGSDYKKWMIGDITRKYPTNRDAKFKSIQGWLEGKRIDDGAEGLWRIYDGLYDFTDFIKLHPGGPSWLKETKGTDITEAFEAHHISIKPEKLLGNYKIRDAKEPRNIKLTLKEDGFYKTLKRRVREKLGEIDYKPSVKSDIIHTCLLISAFAFSIAATAIQSNGLILLGGLAICWTTISAHNYFHRKDNWRMYTFNLSLMSYWDWRVSHALSHHMYPNSYADLELSLYEPFFCWVPNPYIKNWIQRYVSWIYGPFFFSLAFILHMVLRIIHSIRWENVMYPSDLVQFSLPVAMYLFTGADLWTIFKVWMYLEIVASFFFGIIGLNTAHHHPELYHPGDALLEGRDWGLYQIDTIADRPELKGSQFLVLTQFGEHVLHHLFPTLDHGILPQLYPILFTTLKEFRSQLEHKNWFQHIIGQHQQLARVTPNKIPKGLPNGDK